MIIIATNSSLSFSIDGITMSTYTSATAACAAAISRSESWKQAIEECIAAAKESLGGPADLALIFLSPHHAEAAESIAAAISQQFGPAVVAGCTGESIAGTAEEIEGEPAIALWLARWPDVKLTPMHLRFERTAEGGALQGWPESLAGEWSEDDFLIVLAEPFTFPADYLLERLNEDRPLIPVIGGMASGGVSPGENRLIFGDRSLTEGAVVLHVSGSVRLKTVVSQGCRPIGRPFVVTKAERNVIHELGGRPALLQLREIFETLPTSEQRLVQTALHIGRVVSEYKDKFEHGDFLVRNVMGIDSQSGAIAIGDYLRPGQTVQFHIRDEEASDAELKQLLTGAKKGSGRQPIGALLFTCNGRGTRMFSEAHHDAQAVANAFGQIPLAGFFAQGELGPIGQQNFVHGFTASIGLFYIAETAESG